MTQEQHFIAQLAFSRVSPFAATYKVTSHIEEGFAGVLTDYRIGDDICRRIKALFDNCASVTDRVALNGVSSELRCAVKNKYVARDEVFFKIEKVVLVRLGIQNIHRAYDRISGTLRGRKHGPRIIGIGECEKALNRCVRNDRYQLYRSRRSLGFSLSCPLPSRRPLPLPR